MICNLKNFQQYKKNKLIRFILSSAYYYKVYTIRHMNSVNHFVTLFPCLLVQNFIPETKTTFNDVGLHEFYS